MTEKEFDDIFKSLRDYTETPSEDTWKGIEKKMDRRRNSVMLRWIGAVSAAAAIIVGILLAVPHESAYAPDGVRIISGEDMTAETLDGKSEPGMSEPGKSGPGKPDFSQATAPACQAPEGTAEPAYIEPELPESNAETGKPVPESESGMQQHQSRQPQRTESDDDWSEGSNWRDINQQTGRTRKYTAAVLDLSTTAQAGTLAGSFTSPAEARYIRKMNAYRVDPGLNKKDTVIERSTGAYSIPVSVGVGAKIRLSDRFDLGIGINYTVMSRKLAGEFNGEYYSQIRNVQQYIGIPVNLYYNIIRSDRVSVYVQAGGAVERGLSDSYRITGADNSTLTHHEPIKGVQFSVSAGIGIEYWVGNHVGLYFDPTIRYYLDNYQAKSIRTDQPLQTGFEIGVRFRF